MYTCFFLYRIKTMKKLELDGKKINRWTVNNEAEKRGKNRYWNCTCECGNTKDVHGGSLTSGTSISCGCFKNEVQYKRLFKHGDTSNKNKCSILYGIWINMKSRCTNPKTDFYYMYGGAGITVCNDWCNDYTSFKEWSVKNGYKDGLTIDRIDGNKNYSKENCRWVTQTIQARNKYKYNNNTSGYTGVYWHESTNKWRCRICVDKKNVSLGLFKNKIDAAKARNLYIDDNNLIGFKKAIL